MFCLDFVKGYSNLLHILQKGSGTFGMTANKDEKMIQDDFDKIEEMLKRSEAIKKVDRTELLTILAKLRKEIADLSQTHYEHAESIVGFAKVSAYEATRREKSPALLNLSIEGLTSSAQGFEISHPRLVGIINAFCAMLSNMGI
jgi:hypothetical protein